MKKMPVKQDVPVKFRPYKPSAEMKQAEQKSQIQPKLISMASNLAFVKKDFL